VLLIGRILGVLGAIVGAVFLKLRLAKKSMTLSGVRGDLMGIEHSFKEEPEHTRRCPWCLHVSTASVEDGRDFYFYCQNPACSVERIYGSNAVMVGSDGGE
jgi:hypothetical protein